MSLRYLWPILAVISTAAAVAGFTAAYRLYLRACALQLDPPGRGHVSTAPRRPTGKVVVFFGDSRAAQWIAPESGSDITFVNRGIAGQTTAQILGRFEAHVAALSPDIVVVQAGSNDLKCIPLFPDRAEAIERNCVENLREIVTRSVDSGATVILTTIFPHGRIPLYRRPFFDSRVTEATKRVNEELRRLISPRVIVLDTWPILAGADGLVRPEFERDLLHLTPVGYAALNARLVPVLTDVTFATTDRRIE